MNQHYYHNCIQSLRFVILFLTASLYGALLSAQDSCNLEVTVSVTVARCDIATACLKIEGGTAPYRIFFSNSTTPRVSPTANNICFQNLTPGNYGVKVEDAQGCTGGVQFTVVAPPSPFSARVQPVSCHRGSDGAIDLEIPIDIAPVFFQWSGPDGFFASTEDIKNLRAGKYRVRVFGVNAVCLGVGEWEVKQPNPIKIDFAISLALCGSANVCALIEGGTAPYRVWGFYPLPPGVNNSNFTTAIRFDTLNPANARPFDPTSTGNRPFCMDGLASGTYYAIVQDANGCFGWNVFRIHNAATFQQRIEVKNVSCTGRFDGRICYKITGGTPPYRTTLSGANAADQRTSTGESGCFDNLRAGEYILTTTDSTGCSATERVRVIEPTPVEASFVLESNDCVNGAVGCLRVSGGTRPYRVFAWIHPNPTANVGFDIGFRDDGTPFVINARIASQFVFNPTSAAGSPFCARNIPPGDYILIIVDANNCYDIVVVNIPPSGGLRARFELANNRCDTTASGCLFVEGGTMPYEVYVWAWNSPLTVIPRVIFVNGRPRLEPPGAEPVEWRWQPSPAVMPYRRCVSNIAPGNYFILVVDKNLCYQLLPVNVPRTAGLRLTTRVKDVSCHGSKDGQIRLQIAGGEAPYTIFFNQNLPTSTVNDDLIITFDSLAAGVYSIQVVDKNGCSGAIRVEVKQPAPIEATFVPDSDSRCNGITGGCLRVAGGTAPYRFSIWRQDTPTLTPPRVIVDDNGAFRLEGAVRTDLALVVPAPNSALWCIRNVPPGNYWILILDNNRCFRLVAFTIPSGSALRLRVAVENPACNITGTAGGTIRLGISGGVPPYQIRFAGRAVITSDSIVVFENVPPGRYPIQVFDNRQCSATIEAVVEPGRILANLRYSAYGDSACVRPSGGTAPYKIEWIRLADGAAISNDSCVYNLTPGAYWVRIFDNAGCNAEELLIIDPDVCDGGVARVRPESIVSGDRANLVLTGHTGVSIQWQFKTEFIGWIDIPGATTETFVTPPIHTGISKVIVIRAKVICADGTIVYSTETSLKVRGNARLRNYDARVEDANLFNPRFRRAELLSLGLAVETPPATTVYPTICRDVVQIRFDEAVAEGVRITVLNELGRPMHQTQLANASIGETTELSVSNWQPGVYFIRIESGSVAETKRIIVK